MKRVIVTGAAGGMGKAVCATLLERGFAVLGLDHNQARIQTLSQQWVEKPFHGHVVELGDSRLEGRVGTMLAEMGWSTLFGLVNLAGVSVGDSLEKLTDQDWDTSLRVNVTAPMVLSRFRAGRMRAYGSGSIVNVSSPVGFIGARKPSYAASKAALTGLTMSAARNLGADNIRVNLLLPGTTLTFMTNDWPAQRQEAVANESFLKRMCTPPEVAGVIAFLLSDDATYMTGSIVDMTAGSMVGH